MKPLLRTINLSKSLGVLPSLWQVNVEIRPGEVVGLAGESGAGRSVLCMLMAGLYPADEGIINFAGQTLIWPFRARKFGIETIHQTPDLADNMDITSNIFLGNEIDWPGSIKWPTFPNLRRMDKEASRILAELDIHVSSLREKVTHLSSEHRQMLSIARVLTYTPKLVIVDNPTPLLSYHYQEKVLSLIQKWQQQGTAVIFNSNYLDHLFAVTDRIIVLHRGRVVAEYQTDDTNREKIVAAMVGTTDRQQLTPVIWALDSYYRSREQAQLLRQKQSLLEKDLAEQDTLNRQLRDRWIEQIDALNQANHALQDAQRRLLTEREEERKLVAREIHDLVIQDLLGVNYYVEEIEAGDDMTPSLKNELAVIKENILSLVDDLRHICGNLRPPTIDSFGLGAALQSYTHDWSKLSNISVTLNLDTNLARLPENIELSIFRIVQEGLSNVRKHTQASAVEISLQHVSPRMLMVSIADNGQGLPENFDLAALPAQGHFGLLGISERVALLGGRLDLKNPADGGLTIQVEIPHPRTMEPSNNLAKP